MRLIDVLGVFGVGKDMILIVIKGGYNLIDHFSEYSGHHLVFEMKNLLPDMMWVKKAFLVFRDRIR